MLSTRITFLLFLLLLACTPENEKASTTQVELENPAATADSVGNTAIDGTATTHTAEGPQLPLPQPVLQLLQKKYPDWQTPVLMEGATRHAAGKAQGPLEVRADFDGNNMQDIAMQLRHRRNVVVVALLQDSTGWQLHELKKDILFNERGSYKSLYYLFPAEKGTNLYNYQTNQNFLTAQPAVSVGLDDNVTTFVYQEGEFKQFEQ